MKAIWVYLQARLKNRPISWAEAKHKADKINLTDIVVNAFDRTLTRAASLVSSYKLFLRVDVGMRIERALEKTHKWMTGNAFGRYILRVLSAETDLRKVANPQSAATVS